MEIEKDSVILNCEEDEIFYKFKLDNYEGPLDLLLDLVKHSKMDIMDVKLSLITDQYMAYLHNINNLDMEKASEFITVAATLLEIKSKSLLPSSNKEEDSTVDNAEQNLLIRLAEYKLLKEAGENLANHENISRLYKMPDNNVGKLHFVLSDVSLDDMISSFVEIMGRVESKIKEDEPKKIEKDRFTVAEKIVSIKDAILLYKKIKFTELFEEGQTKSELINIFLAVLELVKMQVVKARQGDIYGEIEIISTLDEENK